ncbi:hypothetical protein BDZ91DRAFT_752497 [Kalaharituber pfeilii]|nr:hypothetical protein BDZ91DRAFT_752497 [Kalaharituber pfeilii]
MAWFLASSNGLDEQVEKATSSNLEDLVLNLEISDMIRSKTVQPKEAMRSLKRRIGNKNPNIQLAALRLTDTCVKNGGSHFLAEIASREFMDNLVSILNAPGAATNEVRAKILELIQIWAFAFDGKSQLSYVKDVYNHLKNEGFDFPPPPKISSSFVDSSAPPEWTDSDVCMRCRNPFTFTNRKHHCRNCGSVFCGSCSSKTIPLPDLGIVEAVRVCDGCHIKLTEKKANVIKANTHRHLSDSSKRSSQVHYKSSPLSSMQPRNARVEDDDDEDLKMALKMSLEEVKSNRNGFISQSQLQAQQKSASTQPFSTSKSANKTQVVEEEEEEEDEELKAAIAASLRDMEEQKAKSVWSNPATASSAAVARVSAPRPDHELTPLEAENINLFATLVDRLQTQPPGTILREPQIQELYESIGALRPKLARTFGETMSKYEVLCDLHAKLATVVRYYDKMLEERLQETYSRHNISGLPTQTQRPAVGGYPSLPPADGYYSRNPVPEPQSTPYSAPPASTYHSYYTQPQVYDKMPEPQLSKPQGAYYNGYPPQQSMPTPVQHPAQPSEGSPAVPAPHSPIQQHQQPLQPQPQQSVPPPAPGSYWQYPPAKGHDPAYPYPYPPLGEPHPIPAPHGYAYPGGGGLNGVRGDRGGLEATSAASQPPPAKPAEEPSLIDL